MALENRVFSTDEFQAWGDDNAVLFAAVMTKIEGRPHDDLLRTCGFGMFPSLAVLDANGEVIAKKVGRNLYSISTVVAAAAEYTALKAHVAAGEQVDAADWFMARLGVGELDLAEATNEMADAQLSAEQAAVAEQQMFVMEMANLAYSVRRNATAESKTAATNQVFAAFRAGKRLPSGTNPEAFFDDLLVDAAIEHADSPAFSHSYARVRAALEARIRDARERLPRYAADLEKAVGDDKGASRIRSAMDATKQRLQADQKRLAALTAAAATLLQG